MSKKQNQASTSAQPTIPARIVIGVTGHRKIENPVSLGTTIQTILKNIRQMAPPLKSTPLLLSVLSPLAEGADRVIARELLKEPGALLEVVLPLKKETYMQDFESDASKEEFEELFNLAKSVRTLSTKETKYEAYEKVGRYIVEQCDVLIAFWDGKPSAGRGGTQEIIQYARENKCPLVWINSEDYARVKFEIGKGLDPRPYRDLDVYNRKNINPREYAAQLNRDIEFFSDHAERSGFSVNAIRSTIEYLIGHYVRADKLASFYQHIYYRSEGLVYSMALAAVIIAAFQTLFFPDLPIILVSEIALMLAVLGIIWMGRMQQWHGKWIDYRFLAERFRSALFMAIADIDAAVLKPPRHLSLSYSPKDWIVTAFSSVWRLRPRIQALDLFSLEKIKQFLISAWIEDQIRFHESTSRRHLVRHQRMTMASYILFGLTIAVVLLHIIGIGTNNAGIVLEILAVIFPAIAASITAIRTQRDYLRTSMRFAEMARHLKELKDRMSVVQDRGEFIGLVKEIEETMLHENEDWRVVVRFHTTEVPV